MPSVEEMRAAGFEPEDYDQEIIEVWPENWQAVRFFSRLRTQWRHGMNGATGLDYTAVLALLRTTRLPRDQQKDIFDCVQVMERAALAEIHRKK